MLQVKFKHRVLCLRFSGPKGVGSSRTIEQGAADAAHTSSASLGNQAPNTGGCSLVLSLSDLGGISGRVLG